MAIDKPTDYFNTKLYTGNGSSQSITGVGFQPDWVWNKSRSQVDEHVVADAVRGVTKTIITNSTGAEYDDVNGVTAFGTDGYTLGTASRWNGSSVTYASWNWKAGGTASSNTDGSITSSVSANTTAGFSIVSWSGTGSNGTIGHGLGATPGLMIIKNRNNVGEWRVWNSTFNADQYLYLNRTDAVATQSILFNSTLPTSSVISAGTSGDINQSGRTYIAYCFAEKKNYSKFGSYVGNSSTDGTFVYLGFKPAWIMVKATSRTGRWRIWDNKINPFNVADTRLSAESSDAENTGTPNAIDLVSNGFKIRTSEGQFNGSGETNIYMAFAQSPFVTSTGIPSCAR